jgi:hypothetical protein
MSSKYLEKAGRADVVRAADTSGLCFASGISARDPPKQRARSPFQKEIKSEDFP